MVRALQPRESDTFVLFVMYGWPRDANVQTMVCTPTEYNEQPPPLEVRHLTRMESNDPPQQPPVRESEYGNESGAESFQNDTDVNRRR